MSRLSRPTKLKRTKSPATRQREHMEEVERVKQIYGEDSDQDVINLEEEARQEQFGYRNGKMPEIDVSRLNNQSFYDKAMEDQSNLISDDHNNTVLMLEALADDQTTSVADQMRSLDRESIIQQ